MENWKPNMPPTSNVQMALAPDTARDRKMRSDTIGVRAERWPDPDEPAEQQERDDQQADRAPAGPPVVGGADDRQHACHHGGGGEQRAGHVGPRTRLPRPGVSGSAAGDDDRRRAGRAPLTKKTQCQLGGASTRCHPRRLPGRSRRRRRRRSWARRSPSTARHCTRRNVVTIMREHDQAR